ncbi:uncharacterized protein MONBRDRAFT_21348 [Monosiga brevicollis MX1]|uniref:Adenylyltransferase and sulfurtransferase MOCS3 homolog n=1 Tax=Monosiga brevicollis TaxID=81824 RepID=A9UVR8_MONBE|nr:uncharacterized protein MONBRDRAFT_21348 [Monosiga brevicollis MX1]EDQ90439.1 predicted protein [Monosiga brevicollis MX1]|eukprot:XP_001744490.1 hypothetical protein [Monosiga brevicollis MX1]
MIMRELGRGGQERLKAARVLIVGCGGLGCPSAMYLAGAGVGTLGLVDDDEVDVSNLHRQTLHTEARQGMPKCESIRLALMALNHHVDIQTHPSRLTPANALELVRQYDVVLDASDNAPTRYLINDACVIAGRPLVSGSALRWEGQLIVYNHKGGPCYRCLFPKPPPAHTVTNCSDGGVLGPIPGLIGCLQALEAMKVILGCPVLNEHLLLVDGYADQFRRVKMRARNTACAICGDQARDQQVGLLEDYEAFCHMSACDATQDLQLIAAEQRIDAHELDRLLRVDTAGGSPPLLVDVRSEVEFGMCSIGGSCNLPLQQLERAPDKLTQLLTQESAQRVVFICRRGNDSQRAVQRAGQIVPSSIPVCDLQGGLHAWARLVAPDFPVY